MNGEVKQEIDEEEDDVQSSQDSEDRVVEVKFSLPESTWQRYVKFFQTRQSYSMNMSHGEKLEMLLQMAEKADDQPNKSMHPDSSQCIIETSNVEADNFEAIEGRLIETKEGYQEQGDNNEGSSQFGLGISNRIPNLNSPLSTITDRYTRFFQSHGWSSKTSIEKMAILVDLADTHPDVVNGNNATESALQQSRESMSVGAKYEKFFANRGLDKETYSWKLKILLDLAESHPKIRNPNWGSLNSPTPIDKSDESDVFRNATFSENSNQIRNRVSNDFSRKSIPSAISRDAYTYPTPAPSRSRISNRFIEPTSILEMHLHPQLLQRYLQFFDTDQWPSSMSDTERIAVLVELAETHPKSIDTSRNRSIDNFEFLKSNIDEAISKAKFWRQKVGNRLGSFAAVSRQTPMTPMLRIPLMHSLWQRYSKFLDTRRYSTGAVSAERRLAILLNLAETHPGLENLITSRESSGDSESIARSESPTSIVRGIVAQVHAESRSRSRSISGENADQRKRLISSSSDEGDKDSVDGSSVSMMSVGCTQARKRGKMMASSFYWSFQGQRIHKSE